MNTPLSQVKVVMKAERTTTDLEKSATDILSTTLPIGSPVTLYMRRIPAHSFSQLKYQAMYVQKGIFNNAPDLDVFLSKELESVENIYQTLNVLDESFELFKKRARLHLESPTNLSPVPVILNCLPPGWVAKIVQGFTRDIGIIRIRKMDKTCISVPGQEITCQNMFAIFHLSDVTLSPGLEGVIKLDMTSIVGANVDLRARNITMVESPAEILAEIDRFFYTYSKQETVRTLQAIQVFIKSYPSEKIPKDLPRPCVLRASPGTFNSIHQTPFFCNETLRNNLDSKVADYLKPDENVDVRNIYIRKYYDKLLANPLNGTVRYAKGRVIRLISDNYAVGSIYPEKGEQGWTHTEVLFDVYDVWDGGHLCAEAGITLKMLMKVGDYIRFLCIPIRREDTETSIWNFKFLAISVVSAKSEDDLNKKVLPGSEAHTLKDICQDKVKNFHVVVGHIEKSSMTSEEKAILQEMELSLNPILALPNITSEEENSNAILWKKGMIVTLIDDEFGILSFEKSSPTNEMETAYALFHRQSVYRNINYTVSADMSEGYLRKFLRPGFPVKFNAFRMQMEKPEDNDNPVQFFASSLNFGRVINRHLHDTHLYTNNTFSLEEDTESVQESCKRFVKLGLSALQNYFTADSVGVDCMKLLKIAFPCRLEGSEACVIYKDPGFLILQVDCGKITVNGMFLQGTGELKEGSGTVIDLELGDFVNIDAVLCHPCGGVQYLVHSFNQVNN